MTKYEYVIATRLVVKKGETYGPYDPETDYHARISGKSKVTGFVFVFGGGVYFTVEGYNTDELKSIYIDRGFDGDLTFVIDPARDQYTFTFNNTKGNAESVVDFILREEWTDKLALQSPFMFAISVIGIFLLSPVGLILLFKDYRKSNAKSVLPNNKQSS